jgi:hypothetical protein
MIGRVIAAYPWLSMAPQYRERLGAAVSESIKHIDELMRSLPVAREANVAAWSYDPCMRAFFATPDDLVHTFSREPELHAFFEKFPALMGVFATLGMTLTERHTPHVEFEGEAPHDGVAHTTLCFGDHCVRVCARTEADLRREIERRLVEQLAVEGLAQLAAGRSDVEQKGRELIETRVALLERQGMGMHAVVGGGQINVSNDSAHTELARQGLGPLQTQIEANTRDLAALPLPPGMIELELERVCNVLADPSSHICVTQRCVRVDLTNVVREDNALGSRTIKFELARIRGNPPQTRAFALVHFLRADLLPANFKIDGATRAF